MRRVATPWPPSASVFIYVALLCVLPVASPAFGANDTDAVLGDGLFPLGADRVSLELTTVELRVILDGSISSWSRRYEVTNTGPSNRFLLAFRCGGLSAEDAECPTISVNGRPVALQPRAGWLRALKEHVVEVPFDLATVEECLEFLDGVPCLVVWGEVEIELAATHRAEIELTASRKIEPSRWTHSVLEDLYLYTERFWLGSPKITAILRVIGDELRATNFVPHGRYAQGKLKPTGEIDGAVYWEWGASQPPPLQLYTYRIVDVRSIRYAALEGAR